MEIKRNVALKEYTTFHIGGPADYFVRVSSVEELEEAIAHARARNFLWRIIGSGSNILFTDSLVSGLTIKNELKGRSYIENGECVYATIASGEVLDDVVLDICQRGWWGMENLSAIPGTVGATPIQNVGAYGVEVADIIEKVSVYDTHANMHTTLTQKECSFGYRHSLFKEDLTRYVVTAVTFRLSKNPSPKLHYKDLREIFIEHADIQTPLLIRDAVMRIRSRKFPDWHVYGTAGSFFKNPIVTNEVFDALRQKFPELPGHDVDGGVKVSLGWILDRVCGFRGVRHGDVGCYEHQALVVVNYAHASAHEVISFTNTVAQCVYEKCGIHIEKEIRHVE